MTCPGKEELSKAERRMNIGTRQDLFCFFQVLKATLLAFSGHCVFFLFVFFYLFISTLIVSRECLSRSPDLLSLAFLDIRPSCAKRTMGH